MDDAEVKGARISRYSKCGSPCQSEDSIAMLFISLGARLCPLTG